MATPKAALFAVAEAALAYVEAVVRGDTESSLAYFVALDKRLREAGYDPPALLEGSTPASATSEAAPPASPPSPPTRDEEPDDERDERDEPEPAPALPPKMRGESGRHYAIRCLKARAIRPPGV